MKVVWTREDDIRNGWYRPMILHRLRGAIRGGKVVGWTDTVVGHSRPATARWMRWWSTASIR